VLSFGKRYDKHTSSFRIGGFMNLRITFLIAALAGFALFTIKIMVASPVNKSSVHWSQKKFYSRPESSATMLSKIITQKVKTKKAAPARK
jgi:hypothetical protein